MCERPHTCSTVGASASWDGDGDGTPMGLRASRSVGEAASKPFSPGAAASPGSTAMALVRGAVIGMCKAAVMG